MIPKVPVQSAGIPRPLSQPISAKLKNMGFFCACLVVFIHTPIDKTPASLAWWIHFLLVGVLCRIAVPFFFLASGFLLAGHATAPRWWRTENRKRLRTLLVPYMAWCLLYAACSLFQQAIGHGHPVTATTPPFRMWLLYLGLDPFATPWLSPLWYVRNLLVLTLLSPLPIAIIGRNQTSGLFWLGLTACAYLIVPYDDLAIPCVADKARFFLRWTFSLEGLFYYSVGIFLRFHPIEFTPGISFRRLLPPVLIGLIVTSGLLVLSGNRNGFYLVCLSLPALLGICWRMVPTCPWPCLLTSSSFFIYCLHFFIISSFGILGRFLPPFLSNWPTYISFLAKGLSTILLCVVAAFMLRRLFPRAARFLLGGR